MNRASIAISCAALVCLTGCGGDPLDYQTALDLLRDRTSDTLRISLSASPQLDTAQPDITEASQRLITDHAGCRIQLSPSAAPVETLPSPMSE